MEKRLKIIVILNGLIWVINALAHSVMNYSISVACLWIHHQPKVPDEVKQNRKF